MFTFNQNPTSGQTAPAGAQTGNAISFSVASAYQDCCYSGSSSTLSFAFGYSSTSENGTGTCNFTGSCGNKSCSKSATIDADRNYVFQAVGDTDGGGVCSSGQNLSSTISKKSVAMVAATQAPTSSAITASTATIACNYTPRVTASTCSAQLQYKRTVDSTWTDAGAPQTTGGYSQISISRNITGLAGSTQYDVRLVITRTTENDTTLTSSTHNFTTLAAAPTVTTTAASSISSNAATLNCNVNPNGIAGRVRFGWGTTDAGSGTWANYTSYQSTGAGSSPVAFSAALTGLSPSTAYFFRALVEHPDPSFGTLTQGATLSFTTNADPAAEAPEESHMHIYNYDGTYGVATDIYFTLSAPSGTSSDRLVTTTPGSLFASGDIKVSKDGGAFANAANSVSQVAASNPLYKLTLSTTEMAAELVLVQIVDQDGPTFRDQLWIIRTKQRLGQLIVDATAVGGNNNAVTLTGVGTGAGLAAVGGATAAGDISGTLSSMILRKGTAQSGGNTTIRLDASASGVNDFYNGAAVMIVSGTGAGQFRIIVDYTGSNTTADVNRQWTTNPDSTSVFVLLPGSEVWDIAAAGELASLPTSTSKFAQMIQFLFQRMAFKRTETPTTFIMFKADSSTQLASSTVSDDGTTQTIGKMS